MASPQADAYSAPKGAVLRAGRSAPQPVEYQVDANGCWTWFNDERAITTAAATFVSYNSGPGGNMRAARIDAASAAVTTGTISAAISTDDHVCPGLVMRPDGKLMAFYAGNPDTLIRYRTAAAADSVASWGATQTTPATPMNCAYANPRPLPDSGKLALFSRGIVDSGTRTHLYIVSDDAGATWRTWKQWMRPPAAGIPYATSTYRSGDEVHFLYTDTHPVSGQSSVYHLYAKWSAADNDLRFYRSDGAQITDVQPFAPSAGTLIYDGSAQRAWVWNIAIDAAGQPRVIFTKYPNNNGTDIRLMTSRWTGSAWSTPVDIVGASVGTSLYAAEAFYTGGACFDARDASRIYLAREVAAGIYEMQKWASADNGATWAKVRDLSTGTPSGQDNARPFSPRGYADNAAVLWWRGTYTAYDTYTTALQAANAAG